MTKIQKKLLVTLAAIVALPCAVTGFAVIAAHGLVLLLPHLPGSRLIVEQLARDGHWYGSVEIVLGNVLLVVMLAFGFGCIALVLVGVEWMVRITGGDNSPLYKGGVVLFLSVNIWALVKTLELMFRMPAQIAWSISAFLAYAYLIHLHQKENSANE